MYMTIGNIDHEANVGQIMFIHSGENPVYDVSGHYLDINKTLPNGHYETVTFEVGTRPPKTASSWSWIQLDRSTGVHFSVFFTTRQGLVNQSLRLRFKDGKWHQLTHVSNFKEVLFCQIPDSFPIYDSDTDIKLWKEEESKRNNNN